MMNDGFPSGLAWEMYFVYETRNKMKPRFISSLKRSLPTGNVIFIIKQCMWKYFSQKKKTTFSFLKL